MLSSFFLLHSAHWVPHYCTSHAGILSPSCRNPDMTAIASLCQAENAEVLYRDSSQTFLRQDSLWIIT